MQYCSLQHQTTSITSHIHNWELFLLWLLSLHSFWSNFSTDLQLHIGCLRTLGVHLSVSYLFCPFTLLMGVSRQEYWNGLPFPSSEDHVLSELSTMTHPSRVPLHGMVHSFIELDKAVVHVFSLVSVLWLWFSVCLPSDGEEFSLYSFSNPQTFKCIKTYLTSTGTRWKMFN